MTIFNPSLGQEAASGTGFTRSAAMLALFGAFLFGVASTGPADAQSRYATPPALTLSGDLASPWMLQLKPKRRVATSRSRARAQRPAGLARPGSSQYRKITIERRKATNAYSRTASVQRSGTVLRRSIAPSFRDELLPQIVDYYGSEAPGTVVVNTPERRLYLVLPGNKARRYGIGVGKPGFEWSGTHKVTRKTEWPDWRPPASMIAREKKKGRNLPAFMPGGPKNPLGARALYLGSTLYRIHGTNQNWSIGKAVSSGCIRMRNQDVMDLYQRVPVGARVKVI